MITAVRCGQYDDILGTKEAASLIALTSFYNKHYGSCSKAFINLESQKGIPKEILDKYIELGKVEKICFFFFLLFENMFFFSSF